MPAGAARVDLTGKTVMPTMVDLHGHIGFQNVAEGTMSKETYTRDNLIDHLQLLAYNGVGAVVGVGDLVSRSDLHGGRTNWGDVPLRVRDEVGTRRGVVQDGRTWHRMAGIRRAGASVEDGRLVSGLDG